VIYVPIPAVLPQEIYPYCAITTVFLPITAVITVVTVVIGAVSLSKLTSNFCNVFWHVGLLPLVL